MNWDEYFLNLCNSVSLKSKDPNTKLGAIIVGSDNEILSAGYNSFVRGAKDDIPERLVRPEKYYWIEHAERNAIYNAARHGVQLKGSRIYVNCIPCIECTKAIMQCGIVEIITPEEEAIKRYNDSNLGESYKRSKILMEECGIKLKLI